MKPIFWIVTWLVGGIALVLLITYAWRRWRAHRAAQAERARVLRVAYDSLMDVVVPDAAGGPVHLDYVLLTSRGLLVIDWRDVPGVIFGGEHMDEWAVMSRNRRFTFANPLGPLYDRVAAVRLAAGEVPVEGRVVFTDRGRFPKGQPPQVLMLAALDQDFPPVAGIAGGADRWREHWARLRAASKPSPLARR